MGTKILLFCENIINGIANLCLYLGCALVFCWKAGGVALLGFLLLCNADKLIKCVLDCGAKTHLLAGTFPIDYIKYTKGIYSDEEVLLDGMRGPANLFHKGNIVTSDADKCIT